VTRPDQRRDVELTRPLNRQQLERWGAFDVFPQSVRQMDALLAA